MSVIRIGIAEDIPALAEALREKVELLPEFQVSWLAPNGEFALARLDSDPVDLVLMDIRMPSRDGISTTRELRKKWPELPVVMCTVFDDEEHILQAILAGANGYLMKDTPPQRIHQAIREALDGGAPMSPLIAMKALKLIRSNEAAPKTQIPPEANLSARESEILLLLVEGRTYQQIADALSLSYGTIRKHVENTYRKLEVHSKLEAIRKVTHGS